MPQPRELAAIEHAREHRGAQDRCARRNRHAGVFAFAEQVIGNPQASLFAAFGSFAMLVLVEFGGPRRTRLVAYLALAAVGAAFIVLATLCSRDAWLAAGRADILAPRSTPPPRLTLASGGRSVGADR
jgi:hypothetical protein